MPKGFVYVLVSPNSNYIKIGGTEKPIRERLKKFGRSKTNARYRFFFAWNKEEALVAELEAPRGTRPRLEMRRADLINAGGADGAILIRTRMLSLTSVRCASEWSHGASSSCRRSRRRTEPIAPTEMR